MLLLTFRYRVVLKGHLLFLYLLIIEIQLMSFLPINVPTLGNFCLAPANLTF